MKVIWNDVKCKCNISDSSFEEIVDSLAKNFSKEDRDFVITAFNSGMYNFVVEYVFNKATKALQDAVFSIGEDLALSLTHWLERTYIANFFDVYILRLACEFGLISKKEKLMIIEIIETLQHRKDSSDHVEEIDKEKAKFFIVNLYESVLSKDFEPFKESVAKTISVLCEENILPYSDTYNDIIGSMAIQKNLIIRMIFCLLLTQKLPAKNLKQLAQNAKNLFPFMWDCVTVNDKKFIAYALKSSDPNSIVAKTFEELSSQIKLTDFSTDLSVVSKLLISCQNALSSHYSVARHHEEVSALIELSEVQSTPKLFLRSIITPSLVCYLGGSYPPIDESKEVASKILEKISADKWIYYFKNFFAKDEFVVGILFAHPNVLKTWCSFFKSLQFDVEELADGDVKDLLLASKRQDFENISLVASKLYFA